MSFELRPNNKLRENVIVFNELNKLGRDDHYYVRDKHESLYIPTRVVYRLRRGSLSPSITIADRIKKKLNFAMIIQNINKIIRLVFNVKPNAKSQTKARLIQY